MAGSQKVAHSIQDSRLAKDVPEQVKLYIIRVMEDTCSTIDPRIHAHHEKAKEDSMNRTCFTDQKVSICQGVSAGNSWACLSDR